MFKPTITLSGLLFAVDADAAVALLFGIVEIAVVAEWGEHVRRHVGGLGLEFLHAQDVGVLLGEPFQQAFVVGGADAVEVEGDDAHEFSR